MAHLESESALFEHLRCSKQKNDQKRAEQLREYDEREQANPTLIDSDRKTRVHFNKGIALLAAAAAGEPADVEGLLAKGTDPNFHNEDGLTCLHQAAIDNDVVIAKMLLAKGAYVDVCDNEEWTPLHAAASCGNLEVAKLLLEQGANVVALNVDNEIPLDLASDSDDSPQELINLFDTWMHNQGYDWEKVDNLIAERLASLEAEAAKRIAEGTTNERAADGSTILHTAAAHGNTAAIELLVAANVPIDPVDCDGWTPLHAAVSWGQVDAARALLAAGADPTLETHLHEQIQHLIHADDEPMIEFISTLPKPKAARITPPFVVPITVAPTKSCLSKPGAHAAPAASTPSTGPAAPQTSIPVNAPVSITTEDVSPTASPQPPKPSMTWEEPADSEPSVKSLHPSAVSSPSTSVEANADQDSIPRRRRSSSIVRTNSMLRRGVALNDRLAERAAMGLEAPPNSSEKGSPKRQRSLRTRKVDASPLTSRKKTPVTSDSWFGELSEMVGNDEDEDAASTTSNSSAGRSRSRLSKPSSSSSTGAGKSPRSLSLDARAKAAHEKAIERMRVAKGENGKVLSPSGKRSPSPRPRSSPRPSRRSRSPMPETKSSPPPKASAEEASASSSGSSSGTAPPSSATKRSSLTANEAKIDVVELASSPLSSSSHAQSSSSPSVAHSRSRRQLLATRKATGPPSELETCVAQLADDTDIPEPAIAAAMAAEESEQDPLLLNLQAQGPVDALQQISSLKQMLEASIAQQAELLNQLKTIEVIAVSAQKQHTDRWRELSISMAHKDVLLRTEREQHHKTKQELNYALAQLKENVAKTEQWQRRASARSSEGIEL
eukprot:m.305700 g.305700  ORF g.305700 m.305700 type:complete len:837 (-) comp18161_c0_seq1:249-2759(-)